MPETHAHYTYYGSRVWLANRPVVTVFSDQSLALAVNRMGALGYGQLSVLERASPTQVAGLLSRSGVVRAYNEAMLACPEAERRAKCVRSSIRTPAQTAITNNPSVKLCQRTNAPTNSISTL